MSSNYKKECIGYIISNVHSSRGYLNQTASKALINKSHSKKIVEKILGTKS